MRRRWTTWLAWGGWLAFVLLAIGTVVLDEMATTPFDGDETLLGDLSLLFAFGAFATVGALVASRQPRNAVGWMFIASPLLALLAAFSQEYGYRALVLHPGSLPLGSALVWPYTWAWYPALALIVLVVLLFPDGKLPGRRWRIVVWLLIAVVAAVTISAALYPGPVIAEDPSSPDNPFGIQGLKRIQDGFLPVLGPALGILVIAAAASMVVRFRRSTGDERQQLKWMTFAVGVVVVLVIGSAFQGNGGVGDLAFGLGISMIPIAAGVAMLKYRLYDIDRVISKTLVYGSLTAVLAAAYVGFVLAGQWLFSSFAGGSNLAIAASTLVVAALFLPVRARLQRFVDRRFYRRRYDAERTLEGFGARLREQVELAALERDLQAVVTETMQPAHASVWLREARP